MWWIIFVLVFVVIVMWSFSSFWKGVKKVRDAERAVEIEMDEIMRLPLADAESRAQKVLAQQGLTNDWPEPLPRDIEERLSVLDSTVKRLLRKYRRIVFEKSGTEIGAEFLLSSGDMPEGLWMIGINRSDDYRLGMKANSETIYEVTRGQIREHYPTIFHYLLLVENPE